MKVVALTLATLASVSSVAVAALTNASLPENDPFYQPADNLNSTKLGDILKIRQAPNPLANLSNVEETWQIQYHSSNTFNDSVAAITTVIIPKNAKKDRFISYQIPEDAAFIECAPSYAMQQANQDPALQAILDQGIIVNTPDYEGPNSAVGAGILEGHLTLDSIRAVLNSNNDTGIEKDAKIAIWGYSGGSIATGWANQLAPSYAPDLNLTAAAVGGYVTNLTATSLNINEGIGAGFAVTFIVGVSNEYPFLQQLEKTDLFANNRTEFFKPESQCLTADLVDYLMQDAFSYFKNGEAVLQEPEVVQILDSLTMGGSKPAAPMLVYQGIKDEIVPVKIVDTAVSEYCAEGADIQYYKDPNTDHTGTQSVGEFYVLDWLMQQLDGKQPIKGCNTYTTAFESVTAPTPLSTGNATASSNSTASNATATGSSSSSSSNSSTSASPSSSETASKGAASTLGFSAIAALTALVAFAL